MSLRNTPSRRASRYPLILPPRQGLTLPSLVTLHGSIDGQIVPPTWQKGFHPEVQPLLQRAHALLGEANHLRIIGYSLPETDSYVPYLLKAGLRTTRNLKSVDVLCLDKGSKVQSRFDSLFEFPEYRFRNDDVLNYVDSIATRIDSRAGLEFEHNYFFGR